MNIKITSILGVSTNKGLTFDQMKQIPGVYELCEDEIPGRRFLVTNNNKVYFVDLKISLFEPADVLWKCEKFQFKRVNEKIVIG